MPPRDAVLLQIVRDHGTPCFVYFIDQLRARIAHLRGAFGGRFALSYAVKSNPNPGVLSRLHGQVDSLDVSSGGEVVRARAAGWPGAKLSFTGPAKTASELRAAIEHGVAEIVLESVDEARLLNESCVRAHKTQGVLVRIAPKKVPRGFGVSMSGAATQFGIDEEDIDGAIAAIQALPGLEVRGLHIYSGTQCLRADAIAENYEIFIDLFRRVCETHRLRPQRLIFGSGIGIPYYENDKPVDLAAVAARVNPALDQLAHRLGNPQLVLETGRYLIGEAGVYLTRVIRKKSSRGAEICLCDGGMNHHLGAAGHLGTVLFRNYRMFRLGAPSDGVSRPYNLVGPLCTSIDSFGRQVQLPEINAGDVVGIECSGAYGVTASPIHFISHPPPRELLVETVDGKLCIDESSMFRPPGDAAAGPLFTAR